ncbi:MAG TPA: zinc-dependent metalloprotease [Solirubrobacteraceae bacterium]|nr:zinc-dependent metalloprotease [Solirubrobacteraceae bacterium]
MIDERLALRAATLVSPSRRNDPAEVSRLRSAVAADVAAADQAARRWTGLGRDLPPTPVRVVSRIGWVRANLVGLRGAFDPLAPRLAERPLAPQIIGAQVGTLLGLLSSKVLGQYVLPLGREGEAQLVLVGPNLLELSHRFGLMADDVRRCVLLHELAHRLQFDAVPWLADHLRGLLDRYLAAARFDTGSLMEVAGRLPSAARAARDEGSVAPLLQAVLNDEQRGVVDSAQALMSLLEGHGNATMYGAADGLVDDPDAVRDAVERRRTDVVSKVLGVVAGLELKRRQYRDGEAFVRFVVDRTGTEGLNRAFDQPAALPTIDEIADPGAWLSRVA